MGAALGLAVPMAAQAKGCGLALQLVSANLFVPESQAAAQRDLMLGALGVNSGMSEALAAASTDDAASAASAASQGRGAAAPPHPTDGKLMLIATPVCPADTNISLPDLDYAGFYPRPGPGLSAASTDAEPSAATGVGPGVVMVAGHFAQLSPATQNAAASVDQAAADAADVEGLPEPDGHGAQDMSGWLDIGGAAFSGGGSVVGGLGSGGFTFDPPPGGGPQTSPDVPPKRSTPDVTPPLGRLGGLLPGASVPEPGSWALLVLGFGGLGGALRAGRRPSRVAPAPDGR